MTFTTLISNQELVNHLNNPGWVLIDCRFDMDNPDWGYEQYLENHIPGAVYAHQNNDLAGKVTAQSGRHPLPVPNELHLRFGDWGIAPETQVVAYDEADGSKASRLWWLLHYYSHTRVAVMNGGLLKWNQAGYPLRHGEEQNIPTVFYGEAHPEMVADLPTVDRARQDPAWLVVDARSPERHQGMVELIDAVAGRIPGSINYYYGDNLNPGSTYRNPQELRQEYTKLLAGRQPDHVIMYCGSGITACVNLLALEYCGFPGARLYPGSWSEWIRNPANPVAMG
jgi:thiosulfate/3-mercaptopyruvate sulfurtransferase